MELHYKIVKGLKPDFSDRLLGLTNDDESIHTIHLFLTEVDSKQMISNKHLSKVFGSILHKLAKRRVIRFFFPYDVKEIREKIKEFNIVDNEESGRLWIDVSTLNLSDLIKFLESVSFTTFYVQVDGDNAVPSKPAVLFKKIRQSHFIAVFTLYDESVEILTTSLSVDNIVNVVRKIGMEENIKVIG